MQPFNWPCPVVYEKAKKKKGKGKGKRSFGSVSLVSKTPQPRYEAVGFSRKPLYAQGERSSHDLDILEMIDFRHLSSSMLTTRHPPATKRSLSLPLFLSLVLVCVAR